MRIEEYISSSEDDTNASSSDSSMYEETTCSESSSDRENNESANNNNRALRPAHRTASTQTDGNETDLPQNVIHPPPGVVVPMFNHLPTTSNGSIFIPGWPHNPPTLVPNYLAIPVAMNVPIFPQFFRNTGMYPNQTPLCHIYPYPLNMYPQFPGYGHQY
ncbi:uncharacterized protein LOC143195054 [Rhynchophorus ferrugineus]|uniref:Uncharacterized protein n=1 Tax=Rhynchophorus ferrugineus TaxID=354439 RepID=A0A834MLD2_RHYFE|nr:hypothetical protein GWI33_002359 [Rhynchophorus ferrugineus]